MPIQAVKVLQLWVVYNFLWEKKMNGTLTSAIQNNLNNLQLYITVVLQSDTASLKTSPWLSTKASLHRSL